MGRGEGNVAEKRFLARTFVNKLNGFPADEICHITFFANSFPTAMPIELLLPFVGKVVESPVVASGEMGEAAIAREYNLHDLLKRPGLNYSQVANLKGEAVEDTQVAEQVEIQAKYDGYIARQLEEIEQLRRYENTKLPTDLEYDAIGGLSNEVKQKLQTVQPETLGVASRISGVTPAAISQILIHLKKRKLANQMTA